MFCGAWTRMSGTKQCDNCYEVSSRLRTMPREILRRILVEVQPTIVLEPRNNSGDW